MTRLSKKESQTQILKSTSIVGGSKVITIIIGICSTKIIAVLLGPVGVGIIGLFQSTIMLVSNITSFGLNYSAVRDIAEANGTNDQIRISKTILVFRRWIWFTGIIGMLTVLIFCRQLSRYAFGDESNAISLALLSVTILISTISLGQTALLQGLRQIGKMAKAQIWGAVASFCISIPFYFFFGIKGYVPAAILVSLVTLFVSWSYSRRVRTMPVTISYRETCSAGMGMAKLGLYMVLASFISIATMYLIRIFISHKMDLGSVGLFQASWSISAIYLGFVLDAMGADYYPRLSAIHSDNRSLRNLVNEQSEISLLLTLPLVIGMMTFIPFVISLFYSNHFTTAIPLLQLLIPGIYLRVIAWPMGFVLLAKSRGNIFIITQFIWNAIFISIVYFGWEYLKMEIIGIAALFAYTSGLILNIIITRKIANFKWSKKMFYFVLSGMFIVLVSFLNVKYIQPPYNYMFGSLMLAIVSIYSGFQLNKIISFKSAINKLFNRK